MYDSKHDQRMISHMISAITSRDHYMTLGLWLWRAVAALAAERGLSSWGAQVSCLVACGIFPHQGSPSPPALAGGFSVTTTGGVPSLASFVFALYLLFFYFLILSSKVTLSSLNFK